MVSRRDFLRGSAAAGLVSTAPLSVAAATRTAVPAFEAVCDTRWAEGNAFLAALGEAPYRTHGIGNDPGAVLRVIAGAVQAQRPVIGITSDAALLLAEHVATRDGYTLVFHSEHRHDGADRLTHVLRTDAALAHTLRDALPHAGAQWPALLARNAGALGAARGCGPAQTTHAHCARPAGSPGHLAVWALAPALT